MECAEIAWNCPGPSAKIPPETVYIGEVEAMEAGVMKMSGAGGTGSTRRSFLARSVAAVSAMSTGRVFVHATDKAGLRPAIVGSGEFTYECFHNWDRETLPRGNGYGHASHGVAVDAEGLIYITHHGTPGSIFVFSPERQFLRAMGEVHVRETGKGHGIDVRTEGNQQFLYLAANDAKLFFTKMTLDGQVIWKKDRATINKDSGGVLDNPRTKFRPTNTSFRTDGGYYLGDGYGSNLIFEYDRNDQFVRVIGERGTGPGQFSTPHGQWLDDRGETPQLVVADRANQRLQWFDAEGRYTQTLDGFHFPADVDIKGQLMLVPDLHARITLLNGDNQIVAQLGDDDAWRKRVLANSMAMRTRYDQWEDGRFVHPHDACFDRNGDILVTEWVRGGRVSRLVHKS
jgi:6-bladed beta-propeller